MANIAQMVNVLQAMLLTEGDKMIKTPTYHVFDLYKAHQDAELIDTFGSEVEHVSHTVSKKDNQIVISLCNYDVRERAKVSFDLDTAFTKVSGEYIIGDEMNTHNDFDHPEVITIEEFKDFAVNDTTIHINVPAMSVVTLKVTLS